MWLSYPIRGNVPPSITPDTVWPELALQTTNGSICCLIGPALSLALILSSPSSTLHLEELCIPSDAKGNAESLQIDSQTSAKQQLSSPQICFVFSRWLRKIKGISLRFIFFAPSSHYPLHFPSKLPLLQTLSHQSAPLACTETGARLKKYNNEKLTGSDSRKADAVRGLGRWYYEQAILCLKKNNLWASVMAERLRLWWQTGI